jgi:hypothetical protein
MRRRRVRQIQEQGWQRAFQRFPLRPPERLALAAAEEGAVAVL